MNKACSICLMDLEDVNIMTLSCKHTFHIDCYTKYIIHEVGNILTNCDIPVIKCPMCRGLDRNMFLPILEALEKGIESETNLMLFLDEVEDTIIKEFIPHLLLLSSYKTSFSKRILKNILRKTLKEGEKEIKLLIKDIRNNQ